MNYFNNYLYKKYAFGVLKKSLFHAPKHMFYRKTLIILILGLYTMHTKFSNLVCFVSLCAHLCAISNNVNYNDENMKP